MRLRTIAKLGMVLSVVLFCTAVGFYGFTKLSMTDKSKDINLFSLVPADGCIGVLESDNISFFLNEVSQQNYSEELSHFRFPGLFNYVLGGLNEYTTNTAHGLSSKMNHVLVSFHVSGSSRDQVVYFRMGDSDGATLNNMLQAYAPQGFAPKKEKYKGKQIYIYPLADGDFLAVYSEAGFFAASYQKNLIEQVIDAKEDKEKALLSDPVFSEIMQKKKSHKFLTLYGRTSSMPFLQSNTRCWSEFDFHLNSDVVYLAGDTFVADTCNLECMPEVLRQIPDVCEDSVVISANKETMARYMDEACERNNRTLFNECVANLSHEAVFMLVADMDKVAREPERFTSYLPLFLLENASLFRSFILSEQLSVVNGRISHITVLTYKD
ncbi:MAG: hypothetical protein Q4D36_03105 [Bacteroidales bacterium]|nr:hypothetical protein [Bacteroidales bacterium]